MTKFSLDQFLHAIDLVLSSTSFTFDGQTYEQIFGSPMGSPLSPILADIVIDDLETQCLAILDFNVPTYYRYVDDVFAIVPKDKINDILDAFNNYHPRLKFTYETEIDNSINFLDVSIIKNNGRLITNWYRKPTFSGRYINYFSSHPERYKFNIISNLTDRAILLSDTRFHASNIEIVKRILSNNSYPSSIINKYINRRLKDIKYRNASRIDTYFDIRNILTIPYIKNYSECIYNVLKDRGFDVVYTVPKRLDCLIKRGKDVLDNANRTGVVYKIDCTQCEATYIGQTKRHLKTRIKEHQADIKKYPNNCSVVSEHRISHDHDFDWLQPTILHSEKHWRKREIAEMFFIKKHIKSINLQKDTDSLPDVYEKIIRVS